MKIEFAFQCGQQWDEMCGGNRRRHCTECDHQVTDLSAMTRTEAEAFLERTRGEACISYVADGGGEPVFRPEFRPRGVRGTVTAAALTLPLLLAACDSGPEAPVATPPQHQQAEAQNPGAISKTADSNDAIPDPKSVDEDEPACDDSAEAGAKEEVAPEHRRLTGRPVAHHRDEHEPEPVPKHLDDTPQAVPQDLED